MSGGRYEQGGFASGAVGSPTVGEHVSSPLLRGFSCASLDPQAVGGDGGTCQNADGCQHDVQPRPLMAPGAGLQCVKRLAEPESRAPRGHRYSHEENAFHMMAGAGTNIDAGLPCDEWEAGSLLARPEFR